MQTALSDLRQALSLERERALAALKEKEEENAALGQSLLQTENVRREEVLRFEKESAQAREAFSHQLNQATGTLEGKISRLEKAMAKEESESARAKSMVQELTLLLEKERESALRDFSREKKTAQEDLESQRKSFQAKIASRDGEIQNLKGQVVEFQGLIKQEAYKRDEMWSASEKNLRSGLSAISERLRAREQELAQSRSLLAKREAQWKADTDFVRKDLEARESEAKGASLELARRLEEVRKEYEERVALKEKEIQRLNEARISREAEAAGELEKERKEFQAEKSRMETELHEVARLLAGFQATER